MSPPLLLVAAVVTFPCLFAVLQYRRLVKVGVA